MSSRGTLKALPNRDGTVRWVLYFREVGQPDAMVRCTSFNTRDDRPSVELWAEDVRRIRAKEQLVKVEPLTVSVWFGRYFAWRGGETIEDSRGRFKNWIEPKIGNVLMVRVTRDILERDVSAWLDENVENGTIGWKTAANIWGEISSGFAVAVRGRSKSGRKNLALRCLETNPAENAAGPSKGTTKSKPFLRPDELHALLSCARVMVHRRRVYAVASYTALRQSELRGLRVRDVDFDTMQISVVRQRKDGKEKQRTKTGRARIVQIEPNLVPLLRALVEGKGDDDRMLRMQVGSNHPSETLRSDLIKAGCKRDALHVAPDDPLRSPMHFHNLRDTCLTHMAVRRDPPQDVQWRAGHTTPAMTESYIASARYQAGSNFGTPLDTIPAELLEGGIACGIVATKANQLCGTTAELVEAPGIEESAKRAKKAVKTSNSALSRSQSSTGLASVRPDSSPNDLSTLASADLVKLVGELARELARRR